MNMKGIQRNGFLSIIAQAISEMEEMHGEFSSLDEINLAELGRRTGLSRAKLRRLKTNGFCEKAHGLNGQKIGRASCREREGSTGGGAAWKKKKEEASGE